MMLALFTSSRDSAADQLTSLNSQVTEYITVLFALGGVLVLAYVILKVVLPRMFGITASNNGPIQVLARYPLEPKKTLYLVKTGTQVFLVGTSESQIEYLTAIAPENAAEIEAARNQEAPRKDFRQFLSRFQKTGRMITPRIEP
jgi:flagellar biogenesis protein FliO